MCGILFVPYTAIQWEFSPQESGFGSAMTCRRLLRRWNEAGVWRHLHEPLLAEQVDRARPGSKHHLVTWAHGIPQAV